MRILLLSHRFYPDIGGIETMSLTLARGLLDFGHQVKVLTWTEAPGTAVESVPVYRNPGLSTLLRQFSWADCVIENNPCIRLGWPGLFIRRPTLTVLHTWISRENGNMGLVDLFKKYFWLSKSLRVVAVSETLRATAFNQAVVIGNCYQHDLFKIINSGRRNTPFVFLGRLVGDKGVDLAIKAIFQLLSDCPYLRSGGNLLTIIGDGPEKASLVDMVNELDLANMVQFAGAVTGKELVQRLNDHRFILVPSRWQEPFGLVAIEGMACGCIPIVGESGSLPAVVGDAGLVFTKDDATALCTVMKEVLSDANLERSLLAAGKQNIKQFQPHFMLQRYQELIDQIVLG